MKTLIYVPVIHTSADLGSIAKAVAKRGMAGLGEEFWKEHERTVDGFWDAIMKYFDSIEVSGFKLYQDGMIADGEIGRKIVEEGAKKGSKNHEIVLRLLERGASLVKTEDYSLVKKEYDYIKRLTQAKSIPGKIIAYLRYRLIRNKLLRQRDEFIVRQINEFLERGETGILFIGVAHRIIPLLPQWIQLKQVKEVEKTREYQEIFQQMFISRKEARKRFEELARYLVSPVNQM
ncbi:hypothetical protein AUJ66_00020 [Candidatus Desantisbacteria bacterium CG1_02_38_46]|uniref:Uncharacterized protein n=1 Tax=Candidatus Desantisbacteria bacterium CG1_02_38_46 TaxID=1817893 RepID=A0A1J4SKZ0_9BACT|nr:MAG: hypothetical protein AUJ66_00020 [Candidatus Desantisbacteria bacterium CG1_02_38_46]